MELIAQYNKPVMWQSCDSLIMAGGQSPIPTGNITFITLFGVNNSGNVMVNVKLHFQLC